MRRRDFIKVVAGSAGKVFGNQLGKFGRDAIALSRVSVLPGLHRDQIRQSFL